MRLFFILAVVLVVGLGLGGYLFLQSPERALRALEWAVDELTPLNLELRGPVLDAKTDGIHIDEIHLFQDASNTAALLSITGFNARARLSDVLFNRLRNAHLKANSVVVYVAGGDSVADPSPADWMRYLRWLPASIDVASVHVVISEETTRIIPLKEVTGERLDSRRYRMHAAADYEGEPLDVTLYLYALRNAAGFRGLHLRGEFHATRSSRLAIVEGEVRGGTDAFGYDLSLNAAFPDVRSVLAGFDRTPTVDGSLQVQGRVQGDSEGFTLSDAVFRLLNPPDYQFAAQGDFTYHGADDTHLDLQAEGQLSRFDHLVGWVNLDLSSLGRAEAKLSLRGPLNRLAVEHFELHSALDNGLQVDVRGSLAAGALGGETPAGNSRLQVAMRGPKLAVLEQWLGEPPFDPGPWQLSAEVAGDADRLVVRDIQADLGDPDRASIRVTGEIGEINLAAPITARSVSGIALALQSGAPTLSALNEWFHLSLPAELSLDARATLSGTGDRLDLSEGKATLQGSDLTVSLNDLAGQITGEEQMQPQGFRGQLALSLSDTSALSQYLDSEVPVLGGVEATARLTQQGEQFSLRDIRADIDSEQLKAKALGQVDDLLALTGSTLDIAFSNLDTRNLIHTLRDGFHYDKPLGRLTGSARLEQRGETWTLQNIDIENADREGFSLAIQGTLADLTRRPHGDITLNTRIADRALLQAVTGLALPDLRAELRSRAKSGTMLIDGQASLGQSRFSTRAELQYDEQALSGIKLALDSPHVRLADIGLQAGDEPAPSRPDADQQRRPLESLIENLPHYPLELTVNLGGLSGEQTRIDQLALEISGENHQYLLRTLNVAYSEALAEIRGIIDLAAKPPAVSIGGQAMAIDMRHLTQDLGIESDVKGVLNLRGGLSARGENNEEWLRTLDGSVSIALEDAVIEGAAYDVLATDLLAWLYSGAALEESTYVQCTMAQFALKSGVATTDNLFVESPNMIATGKGWLDFAEGKLDITLRPRSKKRLLQIPSSVTLHGDMRKPKTRISPITTTADVSAEALTLIPNLAMKLFGLGRDKAALQPCQVTPAG